MIMKIELEPEHMPLNASGNPGLPRKNDHFEVHRRGKRATIGLTQRSRDFREILSVLKAGMWSQTIDEGPLALWLVQYAPTKHGDGIKGMEGRGRLDSDACLTPVKDALQHAGFISDDAIITEDHTRVVYRKGRPGLRIELREVEA